ncbi:MAG: hypothetical protein ACK56F_22300, partial [bacterium]
VARPPASRAPSHAAHLPAGTERNLLAVLVAEGIPRLAVLHPVSAPGLTSSFFLLMTGHLLPWPTEAVHWESSAPSSPYCRVPITLQACQHLPTPNTCTQTQLLSS